MKEPPQGNERFHQVKRESADARYASGVLMNSQPEAALRSGSGCFQALEPSRRIAHAAGQTDQPHSRRTHRCLRLRMPVFTYHG